MASRPEGFRRTLPALGAAVPITIIFIAVLSIVLTAAGSQGLRLSAAQTSSWIVVIYGLPALPSVVLAFRYRQPMLLTGNVFAIIFFASLGTSSASPSSPEPPCWPARSCWWLQRSA